MLARHSRMESGDLSAFDEEYEALKKHPLAGRQRIWGDELYRRRDRAIALLDKLGNRDAARKFRLLF